MWVIKCVRLLVQQLTRFTPEVPHFEGPVVTARDDFGVLAEEFGSHHLPTVAR